MKKVLILFTLYSSLFTLFSCNISSYEKGDGTYSYLYTSFGQLQTNSEEKVASILLDDDSEITLSEPKAMEGATADTIYRGLIYYSTVDKQTELFGFTPGLVCTLFDKEKVETFIQDPIDIESSWISKNGSYLNLTLLTKIGAVSDGSRMALGIALDHMTQMADGNSHYYLSLYHDQSTVPEYYTDKTYLSLPLSSQLSAPSFQKGDSITIDYTDTKYQHKILSIKYI